MNPCPGCARLTDVPLCFDCAGRLEKTLRFAALLCTSLPTNIMRLSRLSGPYRIGGRSCEKPLPFDSDADDVAKLLAETLASWADELVATGVYAWPELTVAEIALWLSCHTLRLARLPAAGECYTEIRYAVECARLVVDGRNPPSDPAAAEAGRAVWVTAAEAQRYLGEVHGVAVKAGTIRKWAARGLIQCLDGHYRCGDILDRMSRG